MTREELLKTFTTEGGLSTGLHRTFVSRDCAYFKVDVEFKPVGRPDRDGNGRMTLEEDPRDSIVEISRPHLQFSIKDQNRAAVTPQFVSLRRPSTENPCIQRRSYAWSYLSRSVSR